MICAIHVMAQICAIAHAAPPQYQTVVRADEPQRPAIATEQPIVVRGEALRAAPAPA